MANRSDFHTLSVIHLPLLSLGRRLSRLSGDEVMLDSYDLINSVAKTGHLLAALVQGVLRKAVFDDRIVMELPLIFSTHRLDYLKLLGAPVSLRIRSLQFRRVSRALILALLLFIWCPILRLVEVV